MVMSGEGYDVRGAQQHVLHLGDGGTKSELATQEEGAEVQPQVVSRAPRVAWPKRADGCAAIGPSMNTREEGDNSVHAGFLLASEGENNSLPPARTLTSCIKPLGLYLVP
eukprot:scaffold298900_cov33-Tisochrysis_lutea.AAC.4